jgi:hypothetical protein
MTKVSTFPGALLALAWLLAAAIAQAQANTPPSELSASDSRQAAVDFEADGRAQIPPAQTEPPNALEPLPEIVQTAWALALPLVCWLLVALGVGWRTPR